MLVPHAGARMVLDPWLLFHTLCQPSIDLWALTLTPQYLYYHYVPFPWLTWESAETICSSCHLQTDPEAGKGSIWVLCCNVSQSMALFPMAGDAQSQAGDRIYPFSACGCQVLSCFTP